MSSTVEDASDDYKSSSLSEDESEPSGREYSSQDESSDEDVRETVVSSTLISLSLKW